MSNALPLFGIQWRKMRLQRTQPCGSNSTIGCGSEMAAGSDALRPLRCRLGVEWRTRICLQCLAGYAKLDAAAQLALLPTQRRINAPSGQAHPGYKHGAASGHSKTVEYRTWLNMVERCTSSTNAQFPNYGGRGITVCERWRSFESFLADMGLRPSSEHSIDRIDVNGNYEPSNCRWATVSEQGNNRRTSFVIEHDGRRLSAAQWSALVGIPAETIINRIRAGWDAARALTQPRRPGRMGGKEWSIGNA